MAFHKLHRGKAPYAIAICLTVIATAISYSIYNPPFIEPIRNIVFDNYQKLKPREVIDSSVVILDIDEASIQQFGQWPWSRDLMSEMVDRLTKAQVLAIGFDIVFSEPDRTSPKFLLERYRKQLDSTAKDAENDVMGLAPNLLPEFLGQIADNDEMFAKSLKAAPAVLGFFDSRADTELQLVAKFQPNWLGANLSDVLHPIGGTVASMEQFQLVSSGQGLISTGESNADIIRSIPIFAAQKDRVYPALSIEALRVAIQNATGQPQSYTIKTTLSGTEIASGTRQITAVKIANFEAPLKGNGEFQIYYSKSRPQQFLSALKFFSLTDAELADAVGSKIVLFGTSAAGLRDIRQTSLGESVPGVAIHAQIIEQIMDGIFLNRPDWAIGFEAVLAIALAVLILVLVPFLGAVSSAVFAAFCGFAVLAVSWYSFAWYGLLIDPSVPLFLGLSSYLLTTLLLFGFADKERRFIRTAFQHYLSPDMVMRLQDNPNSLKLGGEIRDMSVMFMDIRGFTGISEKLTPQDLVQFLNTLLSPLSEVIQDHEGAIDKYIGDSIMAFWNAPLDVENHSEKACLAALQMLLKLEELNRQNAFGFKEMGLPDVSIGIGISSGNGCVGNMGSATRFDYSVVGDTVNVAARLETATKETAWPILISQETSTRCTQLAILPAGELNLKGKSEAQPVFALIGNQAKALDPKFQKLKDQLEMFFNDLKSTKKAKLDNQLLRIIKDAPIDLHEFINRLR